jgi:acetyl esterase/lipase
MKSFRLAAVLALLLAGGATAQVPATLAERIAALGQSMDPTPSSALYEPLHGPETRRGITVQRDIAYGPDPLHKLDVYAPQQGGSGRPVMLFVHGGGFIRGDKSGSFQPDNMSYWAAQQDMVGININYRLAPANPWPAGAQDLAAAIAWTRANIARYGGDPDRIIVWGHSAGANHVADYVGASQLHGAEWPGVRGAVLLSPNYAATPPTEANPYYGMDATQNSIAGAGRRLRDSGTPIFLADAQYDPDTMHATALGLRDTMCEVAARCPRYLRLADHNHFTEGWAVGTGDQSLTAPLLEWIAATLGAGPTGERG